MHHSIRQTKMSSVVVETVHSPCQAVADCLIDCFRLVVLQYRNFCHPVEYWTLGRGVGRTKMTVPRIVGDVLVFLCQVQRGMARSNIRMASLYSYVCSCICMHVHSEKFPLGYQGHSHIRKPQFGCYGEVWHLTTKQLNGCAHTVCSVSYTHLTLPTKRIV